MLILVAMNIAVDQNLALKKGCKKNAEITRMNSLFSYGLILVAICFSDLWKFSDGRSLDSLNEHLDAQSKLEDQFVREFGSKEIQIPALQLTVKLRRGKPDNKVSQHGSSKSKKEQFYTNIPTYKDPSFSVNPHLDSISKKKKIASSHSDSSFFGGSFSSNEDFGYDSWTDEDLASFRYLSSEITSWPSSDTENYKENSSDEAKSSEKLINPVLESVQKLINEDMKNEKYSRMSPRLALQNFLLNSSTKPVFTKDVQVPQGNFKISFNNQYYIDLEQDSNGEKGKKVFSNADELQAYNDAVLKANKIYVDPVVQQTEALTWANDSPIDYFTRDSGPMFENVQERVDSRKQHSGKLPYNHRNGKVQNNPQPSKVYDDFSYLDYASTIDENPNEEDFKTARGYFAFDAKQQKDNFYIDYDYDYGSNPESLPKRSTVDPDYIVPMATKPSPPASGYSDSQINPLDEKSEKALENHLKNLKRSIEEKLKEIGLLGKIKKPCFTVTPGSDYPDFPPYPKKKIICP